MENFIVFVPILTILVMFLLLYLLSCSVIMTSKTPRAKTFQEKKLENELKTLKNVSSVDALIYMYEESKSCNKRFYYYVLIKIVAMLIKIKAFPKGVTCWLKHPTDYDVNDLSSIMEEFIAFRTGKLKDIIAVEAYCDGFISVTQALGCTDKTKYPKTVALLSSNPEDYEGIRTIVKKESISN